MPEGADAASALTLRLADAGADSAAVGRAVSALADAATVRRLLAAEAALGPPPVPYVWLAAGSQGLREQTALSDQDNALLLDDAFDPAAHDAYFAGLAALACDGLNADGYVYCPGEMMASNPRWRRPARDWRGYFADWIDDPEPKALMLASVLFDLRPVYGAATAAFDGLRAAVLARAKENRIFLAHFAENALARRPPLNMFGGLAPFKCGPHAGMIDLKHDGVIPVVDMARLYALIAGVAATGTVERLRAAADAGALSRRGADDLAAAFAVVGEIRLRRQVRLLRAGKAADNFVPVATLSEDDRRALRRAFASIKAMQAAVAHAFPLASL